MELKGKTVGILAEQMYQDVELWYPYYRLQEAGAKVIILGSGREKEFKGKYGLPVTIDAAVSEINPQDLSGIIIPGGFAPDYMRRSKVIVPFVKEVYKAGKIVGAICHGAWVLISAGIVRDKKMTTFYAIKDDLVNAGANYVDEPVVRDGQIISSRGPEDLPLFMPLFLAALA